jgi:undecaprenyl-diphosphatase
VALLLVILVGFAVPAGPTVVDDWLGLSHSDAAWTAVTAARLPWVVVVGGCVCATVAWRRDRLRAVACAVAPPLALVLAELVAKPLSGQKLGGTYSYPSGSTVGAAALGAAVVLAVAPRYRRWAVGAALAYGVWMAAAVVARGWHYPVDALAGLAFGAGVVAVVDGGLAVLVPGRHRSGPAPALSPRTDPGASGGRPAGG